MRKRILSFILAASMAIGGVPGATVPMTVQAADAVNLVNEEQDGKMVQVNGDRSGTGWSWNNTDRILTLEDGFKLEVNDGQQQAALKLRADATILLKGTAEIITNQKGIEALGSLTIKSEEGKKGYLKIALSKKGENGYFNYGVEIKNPEGADRTLTVTDHTIVEISGGDKCIMCSAGYKENNQDVASNNKATLSITNQSVVQLRGDTAIADGFQIKNAERILWLEGNKTPELLQEQVAKTLSTETDLTMMSFKLEGTADNDKKTYTLTYDGMEHPVLVNTDEYTLKNLGHSIQKMNITPENFTYYETKYSEYLDEENADYRDKDVVKTTTQYQAFTAATGAPKNAAKYRIAYGNTELVTLDIKQREVTVNGLAAKDKIYDGWPDAEIDYSNMEIACTNDTNGTGIVETDLAKLGTDIVPYAKAYYLVENGNDAPVNNPFGDHKNYGKSADVAYTGTGTSAQKKVAEKLVLIDNGTDDNGIATGISLSDPNYKVVPPSAATTPASQIQTSGTIYPRALTDENITYELKPNTVKWSAEGYREENIEKKVKDASRITPNHPETGEYTLAENKDYIVNPNTNTITEVAEYEILLTGQGNYTGTKRLNWSIDRAAREITITKSEERAYNGQSYEITAGADSSGFRYVIEDTDNDRDVTDSLEEGSNLKITYQGEKADGTKYPESLTAPKDAGTYTVTVSVDETTRYTKATASLTYTILPKTVEVVWNCRGGSVEETAEDPAELVYNGTKNTFLAKVTNTVEGDTVNVTGIVYDGTTTGGKAYASSKEAPYEAGTYTARATALDNTNYTVAGNAAHEAATPGHSYTVKKAPVWLTWEDDGKEFVYDAKDHTPKADVHGLYSNEDGTEDSCKVDQWTFTGTDVFEKTYRQNPEDEDSVSPDRKNRWGAVNVSSGTITIEATGLDNPNYELAEGEGSLTADFTIVPRDLSALEVGTADDHKEIWAERIEYQGEVVTPTIIWSVGDGGETLTQDTDYTASLSTKALEYNKNGLNIKIEGTGNYKGETTIPWNVDKKSCAIKVQNAAEYETLTYGDELPSFDVVYESEEQTNEDIEKNYADSIEKHLTYVYTGTTKNGTHYESEKAPEQAGEYVIEVTLGETDHYWEAKVTIPLIIVRKEVTVTGIEAVDKEYDGAAAAVLDFSNSTWEGLLDRDQDEIAEELRKVENPADGYVTYTASFENSNVLRSTDYAKSVREQEVTIRDCAIRYEGTTPELFYNYVIAATGNQEVAQAKITPKKVSISGIKAKDKVYNGSKEAELDLKGMKLQGAVQGEELDVKVQGEFVKTGEEASAKDVRTESGKPAAKTVHLVYDSLVAGNADTRIDNYEIDLEQDDVQKETTAVISPAALTIKGVKAGDKVFDNKTDVSLDWASATIEGVCAGDVITLSGANGKDWASDRYADANVVYDKNGNVIEKTGTITQSKYSVQLEGEYEQADYVVDTIVFHGTIRPKALKGITWSFDENAFGQLPEAQLDEDCGVLEGDSCEPVVRYYPASDVNFEKEITRPYMVDNGEYVAKVVDVKAAGGTAGTKTNYCIDESDRDLTYSFRYEESTDSSDLEITNYQRENGTAYTITYGEKLPQPELQYNNSDIEEEDTATKAGHFTYLYTGKALNGESYESEKPPTAAGSYKVTVTLEETEHFEGSQAKANFVIAPATVEIIQGVSVVDKQYNGTDKAILDFKNVRFDGLADQDEKTVYDLFEQDDKDYIRYTASYEQTDVLWIEKKGEAVVADIAVRAGNFSFILNNETPAILYNYTIAKDGNQRTLTGKIQPRPVTVSGIKAKDKTYDGTEQAELDLSGIEFAGRLKGETLTADVSGVYEITGTETKAADVLTNDKGEAQEKKITLTIKSIAAGDENTTAGNYILAEEGQQTEAAAKLLPATIRVQSGLTAQDKVYNGTTAAELNFENAVWDGVVKADEKALKDLLAGEGKEYLSYDADYAGKDVNWETGEDGTKSAAQVAVTAGRYGFILNETTPQLLRNYVIGQEGSQTELAGTIQPRPVTVSGIKAKDKTYDGTEQAKLDLSGIEFAGRLKGETLTADVSGVYEITGTETKAADVLTNDKGEAQEKKITLTIKSIAAGDENTTAGNYILAEEGQQTEAAAKLLPAAIRVQSGLTAKDKVYNGTTAAELNFENAVWDGVVKADEKALKDLLAGDGKEYLSYDADYAGKDVNWETGEDGTKSAAQVAVTAGRYGFILNETTPQLLRNYVIGQEGSQTELAGTIQPRPVTVSGIKAKDKTYDGTEQAKLDLSGIEFAGRLKGETLTADVSGVYEITGTETKAADVLTNDKGEAQEKKITLTINSIAAGNENTTAGNYILAEEGQQTEVAAKLLPATIRVQSGLTAQDKVYNGTTAAELNFENAVWDGVVKADEKALKDLLTGDGKEYLSYDADYAGKDVNWETGEDGTKSAAQVAVTAGRYGFILNETTPQLLRNYVIGQEGSQTELAGTIQPRPVTVSGIKARDKTYDGTEQAELDLSGIEFAGRLKGETLTADVSGVYEITGTETKAADVLTNDKGEAQEKKITLAIKSIAAGDENTTAGNYILAEEGQQSEAAAKLLPATIRVQSGLTAQDKVYNGTTVAELNFENAVWDGVVKADEKALSDLLAGDGKEYLSYDADYAGKDVNWETGEDGTKSVAQVAVTAGRYGFVLNETTPQLLRNYVIGQEGSQTELAGTIQPRPVTVSGIKAKDKTYDGSTEATLDLSDVRFAGKIKGDVLTAEVSGAYVVTGKEAKAADVLTNDKGEAQEKKIALNIKRIAAGDENTTVGNYILAEEGQQTEATAKLLPIELKSVVWSFDTKTQLPKAAFTAKEGILSSGGNTVVRIYQKADTAYQSAVSTDKLVAGDIYVARVEGYTDTNYRLSEQFTNPIYTFAYGTKSEETVSTEEKEPVSTEEKEPTAEEQKAAARALNKGLSLSWKSKKLTFKWGAVSGADGYLVYTGVTKSKYHKGVVVTNQTSYTVKAENKKQVYKAYVEAYKEINGKKVVIGKSLELRCAGSGKDGYNATKVTVAKKSIKLAVKKTKAAKASVSIKKAGRTVKKTGKAANLRYWSTNPEVASVSSAGKIKGVKKGTCYIYVMARNGLKKKIKVTVD